MSGELILVVDDEPNIVQLARLYLERDGFRVASSADGKAALEVIGHQKPSLVVLDIMLPEMDGLQVCRQLRAENNQIPIIMLSARDEDIDKILGLELGADDYLAKPFNAHELVARVKAILRRGNPLLSKSPGAIHIGDLVIDPGSREVSVKGLPVVLRTQEFDLLRTLVEHKGLVLTREQLLEKAWGFDYFGQTRTVDVHIGHLRKKLSGSQVHIETITNYGYKLVA
jgi:two-component system, OmpR family, alkaline phosphatase synthesis response regulator PhoP